MVEVQLGDILLPWLGLAYCCAEGSTELNYSWLQNLNLLTCGLVRAAGEERGDLST